MEFSNCNLKYFDSHAHYDHALFDDTKSKDENVESENENRYQIMKEIYEFGVDKVVIPAITYESNKVARELFPKQEFSWVFFGSGLHPKSATNTADWDEQAKQEFQQYVQDERTVALKTGLDYSMKNLQDNQKERQKKFFRMFIDLANENKLPLVLHIRDAAEDAIELLREYPIQVEAVVHCYTYDWEITQQFMEIGVKYFGIGGQITRDGMDDLREAVKNMPIETVVLETDAPFVRPKDYIGKVNTSLSLKVIAETIAETKKLKVEDVVRQTYVNACRLYKLNKVYI